MGVNVQVSNRRMIAKARNNGARASNGDATPTFKTARRTARARKMVTERWGNELYHYFPLGKYVVADPDICAGEPTFKHTRIQAYYALDLLIAGWTVERIANEWWGGKVSSEAIRETLRLATHAWFDNLSALSTMK